MGALSPRVGMPRPRLPARCAGWLLSLLLLLGVAGAPLTAQSDSVRQLLRPQFGSGLVWVEPMPMTPRELAALLTGRPADQIADSAIAALTQRFLEAMEMARAQDSALNHQPDWTTSIAGQTVGIDERWIHLGPIKLPSMLLALLPINVMPNPTEAALARKRSMMREDILTAGVRSANLAEFSRAVKALREQREADREFERNRRTPPVETEQPE